MATKLISKKVKAMNRHWKNFQDKDYLGSHNLEQGEEMLLTIAKFEGEEKVKTADGEKTSMVLYFQEDKAKMILNITNATTLASLYGSHPEDWIGKQIQVYAASVKAFGKVQDALRIRDFIPKHQIENMSACIAKLMTATTLPELKTQWESLKASERTAIGQERLNEIKALLA
jgi:hypothetical protein